MFGPSNCEQDYLDEYVLGMQNPAQLVSSLALLLKERNYMCLYDTSILSSPEAHLKKNSMDELNRDFLYKWFLFFKGLINNINSHDNLIIIPEVAEEMYNLSTATLSCIEKRKNQYKALSPQERERLQDIYEQVLNNETILVSLQQILDRYRQNIIPIEEPIFQYLLELIKMLDVNLDLKKPSSRESNDTDERVAARTFYELLVDNLNVAVYTRDDDIRKLISATFKFLISKVNGEYAHISFLKNLSHLNIIAMKYNKEKRLYSRFFESSTLHFAGEFHFPRHLTKNKINQMLSTSRDLMEKIQKDVEKLQATRAQVVEQAKPKETLSPRDKAEKAIYNIFDNLSRWNNDEDMENCRVKTDILGNLGFLAQYFEEDSLAEKIEQSKQKYQRAGLENIICHLKQEKESLQKQFEKLSSQPNQGVDYWQQIQKMAEANRENLLQLNFFEAALRRNLNKFNHQDYEKFKQLLAKFRQNGFDIQEKETPLPHEKLSEITGMPITGVIKTIESNQIRHEHTHAYLTQEHLLLFLVR